MTCISLTSFGDICV